MCIEHLVCTRYCTNHLKVYFMSSSEKSNVGWWMGSWMDEWMDGRTVFTREVRYLKELSAMSHL